MSSQSDTLNLKVHIQHITPTIEQIQSYIDLQHQALAVGKSISFNEYLQKASGLDKNTIVIGDLSNMTIGTHYDPPNPVPPLMDLSGGDFSGCKLNKTRLIACNLADASFVDTDLSDTDFDIGNDLSHLDLRGANLSNCRFDKSYENSDKVAGIKLSLAKDVIELYAEKNKSPEQFKIDLDNQILAKQEEVKAANSKLGYFFNNAENKTKHAALSKELTNLQDIQKAGHLPPQKKGNVIDRSCLNILGYTTEYDPCYVANSGGTLKEKRQYVSMSREDMIEYLGRIKTENKLSINDFAKEKLRGEGEGINPNIKYVADFSSKGDLNNYKNITDLSSLDFSHANLSEANFSGVNFEGSKFSHTNISFSNLESSSLSRDNGMQQNSTREEVVMDYVNGEGANLRGIKGEDIVITNSDFSRAIFTNSDATYGTIKDSKFDYSNIDHSKWQGMDLDNTTFNHASLDSMVLSGDIKKCQFQYAILSKALMNETNIIESDFSHALMNDVQARKTKFDGCVLEHINAANIDLTDAEMKNLTSLEGADLHNAIMVRIKAEETNFRKANLDGVIAEDANFKKACLEGAQARYATFERAIMDEAQAENIDLTGSNLKNLQARKAQLNEAILRGADASGADLRYSELKESDLRDTKLYKTLLEKVQFDKAKINASSGIKDASFGNDLFPGKLINHDANGNVIGEVSPNPKAHIMTPEEQKAVLAEPTPEVKTRWQSIKHGIADGLSAAVGGVEGVVNKITELCDGKVGKKWGRIIGGVALGAFALFTVASAVATMGASVPVILAAAAIAGAVGGGLGALGGGYIGDKIGVGGLAVAGLTVAATGVGGTAIKAAAIGTAAYVGDAVVEKVTGKNIVGNMLQAGPALGLVVACMAGGIGLVPALAGSIGGCAVDNYVQKVTGSSIAGLGKQQIGKLCDSLRDLSNSAEVSIEQKKWIQEQLDCTKNFDEFSKNLQQEIAAKQADPNLLKYEMGIKNQIAAQMKVNPPPIDGVLKESLSQNPIAHPKKSVMQTLATPIEAIKNLVSKKEPAENKTLEPGALMGANSNNQDAAKAVTPSKKPTQHMK